MLAVVWMRVAAQETEVPEQSVMCRSWMWGDGEEPRTAPGFSPFSFFGLSSWVPFTQTGPTRRGAGGVWEVHRTFDVRGFKLEMLSRPTSKWNVR